MLTSSNMNSTTASKNAANITNTSTKLSAYSPHIKSRSNNLSTKTTMEFNNASDKIVSDLKTESKVRKMPQKVISVFAIV